MHSAEVDFMYGKEHVTLQVLGLTFKEARRLVEIISKAANNGNNDHIRAFGWQTDNEGMMVTKGEK